MSGRERLIWGVILGNEEEYHSFESKEEVLHFMDLAANRESGLLTVSKIVDAGNYGWWRKIFASKRIDSKVLLQLYWYLDYARLILSDDRSSEYYAYVTITSMVPEEISRALSAGEPTPAPVEECIDKRTAFQAAYEFIEIDLRPTWLEYKYIK